MFSKAKLPTRLREIAKILKAANRLWYFETCVPISRLLTVSMQFLTWHLNRFSFYYEKYLLWHCETSREFVESSNVQVEYILGFGAAVVIVLTIIIVLILYLILQCKQKRRERQLRWVDTLRCTTLHVQNWLSWDVHFGFAWIDLGNTLLLIVIEFKLKNPE